MLPKRSRPTPSCATNPLPRRARAQR